MEERPRIARVMEILDVHPTVIIGIVLVVLRLIYPFVKQGKSMTAQAILPCAFMGFVSGFAAHHALNDDMYERLCAVRVCR